MSAANPPTTNAPKTPMSKEHKDALAQGRNQSNIVRRYLEALEFNRPKRGRKRTKDSVRRQLDAVNAKLADPAINQLLRLQLTQAKKDLEGELEAKDWSGDMDAYTDDFVKVAKAYGQKKGISYQAWREIGVPADVLKRAGISRASR